MYSQHLDGDQVDTLSLCSNIFNILQRKRCRVRAPKQGVLFLINDQAAEGTQGNASGQGSENDRKQLLFILGH
jgi:hypothetical protein